MYTLDIICIFYYNSYVIKYINIKHIFYIYIFYLYIICYICIYIYEYTEICMYSIYGGEGKRKIDQERH